jgi:hypothetical protein
MHQSCVLIIMFMPWMEMVVQEGHFSKIIQIEAPPKKIHLCSFIASWSSCIYFSTRRNYKREYKIHVHMKMRLFSLVKEI